MLFHRCDHFSPVMGQGQSLPVAAPELAFAVAGRGARAKRSPDDMADVYTYLEDNKDLYIRRLACAVSIESVSGDPTKRAECDRMVLWMQKYLDSLGVSTNLKNLSYPVGTTPQKDKDGNTVLLPKALFGQLGFDASKKTVLVYGHLDVMPAKLSDGWNFDPFQLHHDQKNGVLYGRGATDDKGPVMSWINAIEALQKNNIDIPVNIKFCFECMEESGSIGLADLLRTEKEFMQNIDFTVISDNYWLGTSKPCLTFGLRGLCYFDIEVSGPNSDLHSGVHGGVVREPMFDLVHILNQLADIYTGDIRIPGLSELRRPPTQADRDRIDKVQFDVDKYKSQIGGAFYTESKTEILERRWSKPSLSIHGIHGAFSESGTKTVIPARVVGKFSIRIVPDMQPEKVNQLVLAHLENIKKELASQNNITFTPRSSGPYWLGDPDDELFKAGARATEKVFGQQPDYTREGGSIPVTNVFQDLTGKPVMLLPIGRGDDMAHSTNEKIDVDNYMKGARLLATLLLELAA